jgi:hypothetical protein
MTMDVCRMTACEKHEREKGGMRHLHQARGLRRQRQTLPM